MAKNPNIYRWSVLFAILIPILVSITLILIAYSRISEFKQVHRDNAHKAVAILVEDISLVIRRQQDLVQLFAIDHEQKIAALAQNPDSIPLKEQLQAEIKRYFPDFFTFTIANHKGEPLLVDFEGYIGDVCVNDMQSFAQVKKHIVRIHPNPYTYHFDVVANWQSKDTGGLFFISFKPDLIARLLNAASPAMHELMLINTSMENLIEITRHGARNVLKRDDYRMSPDERELILAAQPIPGTYWDLVDMRSPALFRNFESRVILTYGLIIAGFILLALIMVLGLHFLERKRKNSERVREELFSLFSHDLRTPLVSIRGAVDLLGSDRINLPEEERSKLLGIAGKNARIMQRIVDDILDLQKMEAGRMHFDMHPHDLLGVVNKALDINRSYASQFHVSLQLITEAQNIFVNVDEGRIVQAMTNLLSNAIKFSPEGGRVDVRIVTGKGVAFVQVSDQGPGIAEDFQKYIFTKFAQSRASTTRTVGSTGLGLSIVKHIVEAHHGKVWFETEIGKGSTFSIQLPVQP